MTEQLRVFCVAGSAAQRRGLERMLEFKERFESVGSGNLSAAVPPSADVVLAELLEGESPQQSLLGAPYWVALIDDAHAGWISRAPGVRGLLPRRASEREVEVSLEAAALGLSLKHPDLLSEATPTEPSPLSAREQEVLTALALGKSNKEIAQALGISDHTVKFHLTSIFGKLHAGSRSEAVATGLRRGLVWL